LECLEDPGGVHQAFDQIPAVVGSLHGDLTALCYPKRTGRSTGAHRSVHSPNLRGLT
jgi:hypothetical protein